MFSQPSSQMTPSHSFQNPSPLASFSYNPGSLVERGALAVRQKHDFFRNLWGVPEDLARMMESNGNMQPLDIIGQYKGRALQIPSAQLTAQILNGQASWLSDTIAPIFPTSEFNFESQFREMNQIEFTRTAVGGVPHEQTYRTTSWKDTIEKVQLNARLEMDLAQDPNFGEDQWMFQLAGLASNAMLTIHMTIAFSLVHIAYTNLVGEHIKSNQYDLSRILSQEEEYFAVAPYDQTKFLRMIRRVRDKIPDFDTVIIPYGAINYLAELKGESTSMQSQKVQMDPVTQQLQWEISKGKKSVMTVTYGEEVIHFLEMPQFRVNMVRDAAKEQILRTSVTLAQVIQCDPDVKIDALDTGAMRQENLDFYVFNQTKTQGDEVKVAFTDALEAAFYWDETKPDGIDLHVHSFCRYKTAQSQQDPSFIPWKYNPANSKYGIKNGDLSAPWRFDYNTPNMDDLLNKEKLLDMRGWRDDFFGLTYVPDKREYRVPKRIVDFTLEALPNRAIHKSAKAIAHIANIMSSRGMDYDGMMVETYRLLADIDDEDWTDEYIAALVNCNIGKMYNFNELDAKKLPTFTPAYKESHEEYHGTDPVKSKFVNAAKIPQWRGGRFGALELPKKNGRITQVYPPGFGSGPGLERLAKEADDDTSEWREVGLRAKRVVAFLDMFDTLIREYIGPSDVNDECLTPPWFSVNSPIAVLVDSFRHYRAPVFLGVPQAAVVSSTSPAVDLKVIGVENAENAKNFKKNLPDNVTGYISSITKFIVIVDEFLGADVGNTLFAGASLARLLLAHKLVDYAIRSIYNQPDSDIKVTLMSIAYLAEAIIDAGNDEKKLEPIARDLDLILNINTNKNKKDVAELLEKIKAKNYVDRSSFVKSKLIVVRDRENVLRSQGAELDDNTDSSYDVVVQAVDDVARLQPFKGTLSPQDEARLSKAETTVGRLTTKMSRTKPTISLDLKNRTPLNFLRAPLVAGDRLLEYMQRTTNPLVKPADPSVFFEAPLDIITSETMKHPSFAAQRKGPRVPCTALPFSQLFRQGINGTTFGARPESDYSAKSSRMSTQSRTRDIRDFLGTKSGFSAPSFDMEEDYHSLAQQKKKSAQPIWQRDGESDIDFAAREREFKAFLEADEYFGPHESRYDYIDTISSPFEKAIFKAIMLAPNRITIHKKLAAIGQKLVNVLIFRLFIQHNMSSAIVMKAGKDTIRTAVGHARVWVNTEQRGYSTINAGFYLGTIRVNPNGIAMLPFVFPESFVGGMGTTFMRDKSHFRYRTTDKESMIAMLAPITEDKYEYPIQMLNLPTYTGKDGNNAPHNRKWSSYEFFAHVFGYNMLYDVQGQIEDAKKSYGHAYDISLCVHRSPVRYTEADGRSRRVAGTGPRSSVRMNIPGSEKVWSGERVNFPDIQTDLLRRQ